MLYISQKQHINKILNEYEFSNANSVSTSMKLDLWLEKIIKDALMFYLKNLYCY